MVKPIAVSDRGIFLSPDKEKKKEWQDLCNSDKGTVPDYQDDFYQLIPKKDDIEAEDLKGINRMKKKGTQKLDRTAEVESYIYVFGEGLKSLYVGLQKYFEKCRKVVSNLTEILEHVSTAYLIEREQHSDVKHEQPKAGEDIKKETDVAQEQLHVNVYADDIVIKTSNNSAYLIEREQHSDVKHEQPKACEDIKKETDVAQEQLHVNVYADDIVIKTSNSSAYLIEREQHSDVKHEQPKAGEDIKKETDVAQEQLHVNVYADDIVIKTSNSSAYLIEREQHSDVKHEQPKAGEDIKKETDVAQEQLHVNVYADDIVIKTSNSSAYLIEREQHSDVKHEQPKAGEDIKKETDVAQEQLHVNVYADDIVIKTSNSSAYLIEREQHSDVKHEQPKAGEDIKKETDVAQEQSHVNVYDIVIKTSNSSAYLIEREQHSDVKHEQPKAGEDIKKETDVAQEQLHVNVYADDIVIKTSNSSAYLIEREQHSDVKHEQPKAGEDIKKETDVAQEQLHVNVYADDIVIKTSNSSGLHCFGSKAVILILICLFNKIAAAETWPQNKTNKMPINTDKPCTDNFDLQVLKNGDNITMSWRRYGNGTPRVDIVDNVRKEKGSVTYNGNVLEPDNYTVILNVTEEWYNVTVNITSDKLWTSRFVYNEGRKCQTTEVLSSYLTPPPAPKNLTVDSMTDTSIRISWFPEEDGAQIYLQSNLTRLKINDTGTYNISGLQPGTVIEIRLYRDNGILRSNFSKVTAKTKADTAPNQPDSDGKSDSNVLTIGIYIVGVVVIVVGGLLAIRCIRKCKNNQRENKEKKAEEMVEMMELSRDNGHQHDQQELTA